MGRIIALIAVLAAAAAGYVVYDLTQEEVQQTPTTKPAANPSDENPDEKPAEVPAVDSDGPIKTVPGGRPSERPAGLPPAPGLVDRDELGEPEAYVGLVMDVRGNPLEGATVQVLQLPYNRSKVSGAGRIHWDRSYDEIIIMETTSAVDGSFRFDNLPAKAKMYVRATLPDFITQIKDHVLVGLKVEFRR